MNKLLWVALAGMMLAENALAQERFDFKSYKTATVAQILAEHEDHIAEALRDESKTVFEAGIFKYRVTGTYQGQHRRMRFAMRMRVNAWGRSLSIGSSIADLFTHEVLVEENGRQHWFPVQAQLLPFMDNDLAVGETVDFYVVFIGVFQTRPIFLTNEFSKTPMH